MANNELRPELLVRIEGETWGGEDREELVHVETADQCRGAIVLTTDDETINARVLGDIGLEGLCAAFYVLRDAFGEEDVNVAMRAAEMMAQEERKRNGGADAGEEKLG